MSTFSVNTADLRAARDDVAVFARMVGFPLTEVQARALSLRTLTTVLVGARQVGKTRALSILATWWAFTRPGSTVLVISAGEAPARNLLRQVRDVVAAPVLGVSVVDEGLDRVVLANGSRVLAVPASTRQVRGLSVDLLIVDEAAFVGDELLEGSALPTITARVRTGARVVLSSTPWEASGLFYNYALMGESGQDPEVATFRWRVADCPWISRSFVARMKATMTPLRFRSEYEAEFVAGGAGYFSRDELMAATAPYRLVSPEDARGGHVVLGADWGNRQDWHAICLLALLDDYGRNGRPVFYVPWIEISQARYRDQVERVSTISSAAPVRGGLRPNTIYASAGKLPRAGSRSGYHVAQVLSEVNGVGGPATEALEDRLGDWKVTRVVTTMDSKQVAFARLLDLLSNDQLLLPDDPGLLRELAGLEATASANGGMRIAAAGAGHDDRAMALSFCALGLDTDLTVGRASDPRSAPPEPEWLTSPSGIEVPVIPEPRWNTFSHDRAFLRTC